jgi:hypothetical protein
MFCNTKTAFALLAQSFIEDMRDLGADPDEDAFRKGMVAVAAPEADGWQPDGSFYGPVDTEAIERYRERRRQMREGKPTP